MAAVERLALPLLAYCIFNFHMKQHFIIDS